MSYIEEQVETKAPKHIVFKAWADNYLNRGFPKGKSGYVTDNSTGIKFKVLDVKKNKSITILWHSFFVKLLFDHIVEQQKKNSLVITKVKVQGILGPIVKFFIKNKIRKYVKMSLTKFQTDLDSMMTMRR
ncbi:MAG: hypothetical protein JXA94_05335 [Parachlamydiales bacterium]|nr:hypothetical protein [Parachlamydiales bacterium]